MLSKSFTGSSAASIDVYEPNQLWGLTKTDEEWSAALDGALLAVRRDDLEHGTNAAYVQGCVCKECREHQRERIAKNRK
jgi:hypothetical protein